MATILQDEEQDKKPVQQEQEQDTNTLTSTAAPALTGGQGSAASTATSVPGAAPKPTSSGKFVDVGKFYNVNKGLAQQVGQQVQSSLKSGVEGARSKLGQEAQDYKKGLERFRASDQSFAGKDLRDVNQKDFSDIFRTQQMGNFTSQQGYRDLQNRVKATQATDSEAGRRAALKSIAEKGYSRGEQDLDSILLNKSERGTGQLSSLRSQYEKGYADRIMADSQRQAEAARQSIIKQREAVQQRARDHLTEQGTALGADVTRARETATQTARDKYKQRLQQAYDKAVADERIRVDTEVAELNKAEADRIKRELPAGGPGQAIITNPGAPTRYQANYDMNSGQARDFNVALSRLAEQGYGIDQVRRAASLDDPTRQRLEAYNALRGVAGNAGPEVGIGSGNRIDQEAALRALRGMVRMRGAMAGHTVAAQSAPQGSTPPPSILARR